MKSLILVVLALALTSCLQPESSSVETARQAAPAIVEEIENGIDGTYLYHQVICKSALLTTTKWQGQMQAFDQITINGSSLTARSGYYNTSETYFDMTGEVEVSETSITFQNLTTTAITKPAWTTFADYDFGILSYPQQAGFIDVGVGETYPNVTMDFFEFNDNGDFLIELPSSAYKHASFYNFNPTDRCFMIYEKQ